MIDNEDIFIAIQFDNREVLDELRKDSSLLKIRDEVGGLSLLAIAIQRKNRELAIELLKLGADPNLEGCNAGDALSMACRNNYDLTKLMLDHGADPNLGRPLVSAINLRDKAEGMKIAQLLIDHGINVNRVFRIFDDENNRNTALDFAHDPDMIALLRKHGAKSINELPDDVPSDD